MLNLYDEFKEAKNDDEKWFHCMSKLKDYEIIIANIEYRLGFELKCKNKKIWKYYIEYLRHQNPSAMLDIYRRYCRLFINDLSTVINYRKEIENIEKTFLINVTKWWNDIFEFKRYFYNGTEDIVSENIFQKLLQV